MDGWDPRAFDFGNKSFNSYLEGPGKLIQNRDEKDVITLFVDHIPVAITKVSDMYFNIFLLLWFVCFLVGIDGNINNTQPQIK